MSPHQTGCSCSNCNTYKYCQYNNEMNLLKIATLKCGLRTKVLMGVNRVIPYEINQQHSSPSQVLMTFDIHVGPVVKLKLLHFITNKMKKNFVYPLTRR